MKISKLIAILILPGFMVSCGNKDLKDISTSMPTEKIRLNQLGYFPGLEKKFSLADSMATEFRLMNESGKTVFRSRLQKYGFWEPSGEYLTTGDFSEFSEPGKFFIYVPGVGRSYSFTISDTIYHKAAAQSIESFYFMRASMEMESKYLGKFSRPMGHPDDTCYFHESSGYSKGFISSPGGWYDAGDYGKYIVNASIATASMLAVYELLPDVFPDGSLNIPEQGNGINDLLDEVRYELNWVLTMQDRDGGVFHKLTPLWHDAITMPHETHSKRYIIGKSTAASLDFAAMLAQASRLYRDTDADFSEKCLKASRLAYDWAVENPELYFSNPPGVGTGSYNDKILDEEFFWAAAELFCTTGEETYYNAISGKLGNFTFRLEESWRNYVDNLGYYSLFMSDKLNQADRDLLQKGILAEADKLLKLSVENPYGIPVSRFVWGSNSDVLNTAIIQLFAYEIAGDKKYLNAGAGFMDYIFGRNATAFSYVSGSGMKYSSNFHHRLLMADQNEETFPGFIAGGPNFQMQDRRNLRSSGADYTDTIPAKAYIDHSGSYASNEVCINWNAPLAFVLAYLDHMNQQPED